MLGTFLAPAVQSTWLQLVHAGRLDLLDVEGDRAVIIAQLLQQRVLLHTRWEQGGDWSCISAHLEELEPVLRVDAPASVTDPDLWSVVRHIAQAMAQGDAISAGPLLADDALHARTRHLFHEPRAAVTPLEPARGTSQRAAVAVVFHSDEVGATQLLLEHRDTWQLISQTRSEAAAWAWTMGQLDLHRPVHTRRQSAEAVQWARAPTLPGDDVPPLLRRAWSDFLMPPDAMLRRRVSDCRWVDELNAGVVYIEWCLDDTVVATRQSVVVGSESSPTLLYTDSSIDLERVFNICRDAARRAD